MDTADRIGENVRKKTKRIGGVKGKPFLADDIITNILIRLPAKNAAQCRLVCKGWRDLTLTCDFVDLLFRHSLPTILVSIRSKKGNYFFLDKWWELPARKKLLIHKFHLDSGRIPYSQYARFSHAGLVVFFEFDFRRFIVCNPMDPKHVTITLSNEIRWSEIYGVFFHPLWKEYCSLWMIQESKDFLSTTSHPKWIKYKMLSLGSNPAMKTIGNPFTYRVKSRESSPLFIDTYLYWMLEPEIYEYKYSGCCDIMQFDIINEEFTVMPCPVPLDDTVIRKDSTCLLNVDGTLSFLLILPRKITIWRLEDHARQLWTTTNYIFTTELYESYYVPRATAIVDGKLALFSNSRRLIVCNLMQGTMCYRKTQYNYFDPICSHQMSLASLTNCSSQIFIDQDGEVAQIVSEG